jgi:hypothetical protein
VLESLFKVNDDTQTILELIKKLLTGKQSLQQIKKLFHKVRKNASTLKTEATQFFDDYLTETLTDYDEKEDMIPSAVSSTSSSTGPPPYSINTTSAIGAVTGVSTATTTTSRKDSIGNVDTIIQFQDPFATQAIDAIINLDASVVTSTKYQALQQQQQHEQKSNNNRNNRAPSPQVIPSEAKERPRSYNLSPSTAKQMVPLRISPSDGGHGQNTTTAGGKVPTTTTRNTNHPPRVPQPSPNQTSTKAHGAFRFDSIGDTDLTIEVANPFSEDGIDAMLTSPPPPTVASTTQQPYRNSTSRSASPYVQLPSPNPHVVLTPPNPNLVMSAGPGYVNPTHPVTTNPDYMNKINRYTSPAQQRQDGTFVSQSPNNISPYGNYANPPPPYYQVNNPSSGATPSKPMYSSPGRYAGQQVPSQPIYTVPLPNGPLPQYYSAYPGTVGGYYPNQYYQPVQQPAYPYQMAGSPCGYAMLYGTTAAVPVPYYPTEDSPQKNKGVKSSNSDNTISTTEGTIVQINGDPFSPEALDALLETKRKKPTNPRARDELLLTPDATEAAPIKSNKQQQYQQYQQQQYHPQNALPPPNYHSVVAQPQQVQYMVQVPPSQAGNRSRPTSVASANSRPTTHDDYSDTVNSGQSHPPAYTYYQPSQDNSHISPQYYHHHQQQQHSAASVPVSSSSKQAAMQYLMQQQPQQQHDANNNNHNNNNNRTQRNSYKSTGAAQQQFQQQFNQHQQNNNHFHNT